MKKRDPALHISNPRLLAAVYFGLLSVVGTILTDALLTMLGVEEAVPLFKAILLGMVISSITGALFGEFIVHCPRPYWSKTFWTGFFMVLISLPFFALGLTFFRVGANTHLLIINSLTSFMHVYFVILAYSYILFGFILAIGSGLAAMYLRGYLVYDILHTARRRSQRLPKFVVAKTKPQPLSRSRVASTHKKRT